MKFKLKGYSVAKHNFVRIFIAHHPMEGFYLHRRSRAWFYRLCLCRLKGYSLKATGRRLGVSMERVRVAEASLERTIQRQIDITKRVPIKQGRRVLHYSVCGQI